jgi:hypothetical protein
LQAISAAEIAARRALKKSAEWSVRGGGLGERLRGGARGKPKKQEEEEEEEEEEDGSGDEEQEEDDDEEEEVCVSLSLLSRSIPVISISPLRRRR